MSIILFVILSITLVAIVSFVVYKTKKNTYDCTENGCEFNSNGNGKFNTKKSCEKSCQKTNSLRSSTQTPIPKKRPKPFIVNSVNKRKVISILPVEVNQEVINQVDDEENISELYDNVKNIQEQIKRKKQSSPYYATTKQSTSVITDYDTFPYTRYFRGVAEMSEPIVAEREAGWRPRHDDSYGAKVQLDLKPECVMGSLFAQQEQLYNNECSPSGECSVTF